jgi:L-ascorbate metabolism protein UlaG (beta-lactamase superfamily)
VTVTKYLHSCLLVKDSGTVFLFDPGNYTYDSRALDINSLEKLDYILITHKHQDHMHIPLIKQLFVRFPDVKIISNQSVVDILKSENMPALVSGDESVTIEEVLHEKIFWDKVPPNYVFKINSKLTHPGDTHHLESTTEVLCLPVQAPWGSTTDAVELALRLKPRVVIPIHDWHWNDQARQGMYNRLQKFFNENSIVFIPMETGVEVEV